MHQSTPPPGSRAVRLAAFVVCALTVLLAAPSPSEAAAERRCLQIEAPAVLPIVLDEPGSYCLVEDIEVNLAGGLVVRMDSPGVHLDLNGFEIRNVAADPGGSLAIQMGGRRSRVENGHIAGFGRAILSFCQLDEGGQVIEGVHVSACGSPAVQLQCPQSLFRANLVTDTGKDGNWNVAVSVESPYTRVIDNDIVGVVGKPSFAVSVASGEKHVMVAGNRISKVSDGVHTAGPPSEARCRDNLTSDVGNPYDCLDLGNNQ